MKRIKSNLGFTILELVIALGLLGVISIGTGAYISNSFKDSNKLGNKVEIQTSVTALMNKLETVIKTSDIPVFNNVVEGEIIKNTSFEINQLKQGIVSPVRFEYIDKKVVAEEIEYLHIEEIEIVAYKNGAQIKIVGEENKYSLTSTFYTRNTIGSQQLVEQSGLNVMLAEGSTWYDETKISKNHIEKIILENNYIPSGSEIAEWEADIDFSGDVMCYVTSDYELIVSGQSEGRIYANEDSSYAFSEFGSVTSIEGLNLLSTSNVKDMSNMFYNLGSLPNLDLSSFDTTNITNMDAIFGMTDFEQITLGTKFEFEGTNHGLGSSTWYLLDGTSVTIEAYQSTITNPTTYYSVNPVNSYTLNHYLENADDEGYTLYLTESKTATGNTITLANDAITISNSTYKEGKLGTTVATIASVLDANDLGINLYYTRNTFTLTLQNNGISVSEVDHKYGASVQINAGVPEGYTWNGWYDTDDNLYNASKTVTIIMPPKALTLNAVSSQEIILPTEPATLASGSSWYKGTTAKSTITQIDIVDSYTPTGTVKESWNADVDNTGSIKCYIEGTKLTIAGNGMDIILANADSSYLFGDSSVPFSNLTNINGLNILDTSAVTTMGYMFMNCGKLTSLDVSNFDTSNVRPMYGMFWGCSSLTSLDVSNFDTRQVSSMASMFDDCSGLTSLDVSNFDTSQVSYMDGMFSGCSGLTSLDVSNFNTSSVRDMMVMFSNCSGLTSLDISSFDTSSVTNMGAMFLGCWSLTSLDVSSFDTSNVTDMAYMFDYCRGLTSLDISSFDTSNVTNMEHMFDFCRGLTSLDISSFDTSVVTNMYRMFFYCDQLVNLDLSSFDTSAVTNIADMFDYMDKLEEITLGSDFSFTGDGSTSCTLPAPSSSYITGADGNWYTEDGTSFTPAELAEETRTTATTYYAIFEGYTLTYNANGGSGAPASQTGKTLTISSTTPTRSGWDFEGWAKSSSATSSTYDAEDSITLTANTTLYAVWSKTIKLIYDANGGSNAPSTQTYTGTSTSNKFTISTAEPTPPSGKAFRGWAESSSATVADYKVGANITLYSDTTLYAVYVTPLSSGNLFTGSDVGAYVSYTPNTTRHVVSKELSGYSENVVYNPSSTTVWRVFSNDGANVEIISDETSSTLNLVGETGYINAVQILQDFAKAYVHSYYAVSGRNLGYNENGLTEDQIANYKIIDTVAYPITVGIAEAFPYTNTDVYDDDRMILLRNGSLNSSSQHAWVSARSVSVVNDYSWTYGVRYIERDYAGSNSQRLYLINTDGDEREYEGNICGVRPIIKLYSNLIVASGDGSPSNPYVLSAGCNHSYTEESTDSTYLRSALTCTDYATYYYKCANCTEYTTDDYWTDYSTEPEHDMRCTGVYTDEYHELECYDCIYQETGNHIYAPGNDHVCECGRACDHPIGIVSYYVEDDTVYVEWTWPSEGGDSIYVGVLVSCTANAGYTSSSDYYSSYDFSGSSRLSKTSPYGYLAFQIDYTDSYGGESRWLHYYYGLEEGNFGNYSW